jgi:hypothetical protein
MNSVDPEGAWCRAVLNDARLTPLARDRVLAAAVRRLDWCAPRSDQHLSATHTAPGLLRRLLGFLTVDAESQAAELEHTERFDAVAADLCAADDRAERSEVVRLVRAYVQAALRAAGDDEDS